MRIIRIATAFIVAVISFLFGFISATAISSAGIL